MLGEFNFSLSGNVYEISTIQASEGSTDHVKKNAAAVGYIKFRLNRM